MRTMANALTVRGVAMGMNAITDPVEAVQERESAAKNLLLFFAAPWVGLAYIVAFPFVGFAAVLKAVVAR